MPSAGARALYAARRAALARAAAIEKRRLDDHLVRLRRLNAQLSSGQLQRRVEARVNASGAMVRIMRERFAFGQTSGSRWQPLAPSTLRRRRFRGKPTLVQTERLMNAACAVVRDTFKIDRPVQWAALLPRVRVRYAKYHQEGTPAIPIRPFLDDPSWAELRNAYDLAKELMTQETNRILGR